jgi:hypothetical protein
MPGRKRDEQIAMKRANPLPVTIRPPFELYANAALARSISPCRLPCVPNLALSTK